jgi:Purple acid Phosphatase, N-terminal domain
VRVGSLRAGIIVLTSALVAAGSLALGVLDSTAAGEPPLLVATRADRVGAVPLQGAALTGSAYVFVEPAATPKVLGVDFYIDSAPPATPSLVEAKAPYDLRGGTVATATAWDTAALSPGVHSVTAVIRTSAGQLTSTAQFTTGITPVPTTPPATSTPTTSAASTSPSPITPPPPSGASDPLVHLSWNGDAATTFTVTWRTQSAGTPAEVRSRRAGTSDAWLTTSGVIKPRGTGSLRSATVSGLAPGQSYEYQVRLDSGWSTSAVTRTVSATGTLSFVYLADTGVIGRADGLAAGTSTVLANVAQLDPQLILGGGDYAYYNTDPRWPTLDGAIDAWFSQMQPLTSRAPLQPAYGNHEVLLGEGFGPWADRFTTPTGVAGKSSTVDTRGTYSYDVGPVHFVSIMAVDETASLPAANRTWITKDITAAKARGARWIIPYMHGVPLGDGSWARCSRASTSPS